MGNKFSIVEYKEAFNTFLARKLVPEDTDMLDDFIKNSNDINEVIAAIQFEEF